jgi:hypothetical protein
MRCGPGADGAAAPGECAVERSFGLAGAHYYEGDHEVAFRYTGDGNDLRFSSVRNRNHRKAYVNGLWVVDGVALRLTLEELEVGRVDGAEEEVERVMAARVEGDDLALDLEEVHYRRRDPESESFYITWTNAYDTADASYALDAQFEGKSGATRWVYEAEGALERDAMPHGLVELRGPADGPHPVVTTDAGEELDLL